jgi:hypothetical protein
MPIDTVTVHDGGAGGKRPVLRDTRDGVHATETLFNGGFPVNDAHGATVMRAEKAPFTFRRRHLLLDVSAASQQRPVLTVERSPTLFEVRRRWNVYSGDSTSQSNLLFVAVEAPLFSSGKVHVHLTGRRGDRDPDFVVHSHGFFGREYTVSRSGAVLAQIDSAPARLLDVLFGLLAHSITVNAGVDHAFVVALTVILAEIRHDDAERRRRQQLQRTRNSR